MIYITGDLHGDPERFNNFDRLTAEDTLIVCGDFGFIFVGNESEQQFLNQLEQKPYTICFCDGNHENFPLIYKYPMTRYCGGFTHRIRKNIYHLMRGEVFIIENNTFFAMGGGASVDKFARIEGLSWWKEELPCNSEYRNAEQGLKKSDYNVDYIITHNCPSSLMERTYPDDEELTGFLEWVKQNTTYKKWFFGHWHTDADIGKKFRAIYKDIVALEE